MDVRGVRTGRAHSSGMLGGWWKGWSQVCLVVVGSRGACSLLGVISGWWEGWSQACLVVVGSHGACSLLGDVGRGHFSAIAIDGMR